MKRFLVTLLTICLGASVSLSAAGWSNCDCCPSWCCGSFEVGGQALYIRPTSCDFDYVIVDDRPFVDSVTQAAILPQTKARNVDPDYEWGFRVSLGYVTESNCNDVRVEYTYFHTFDRGRAGPFPDGGKGIWPICAHPRYSVNAPYYGSNNGANGPISAIATSSLKFDYDAVDLQFGTRYLKACNLWIRKYAGLHFMNLDHRLKAFYSGSPDPTQTSLIIENFNDVCWHKNVWGIGPLAGLDARYVIACNFGISGHIGAALLAGETDGRIFENDRETLLGIEIINETLDVRQCSRHILFPYIRAGLGVNYLWCCGNCFNVLIELGYEFNSYINSIGHFRFNDQRATGMANCYSFNLNGLYLSVRATI